MKNSDHRCAAGRFACGERRFFLKAGMGIGTVAMLGGLSLRTNIAYAAALTKTERDNLTPDQIVERMKKGNERFRSGKMQAHDYLAQKRSSAAGQFPAAVILSCIDSRAPAEILFDIEIGEAFNARIAGNIANSDLLGSMEFACAVAGAKVALVMGHTACGAIKGAIDHVELGNLTGLLDKIKPSIEATEYSGERTGKNSDFVDAVARTNVRLTIETIRQNSEILASLEKKGALKIVGSMYDLKNGAVTFMA